MSKRKKQYYVVVRGRKPGIYTKWFGAGGAAEQVDGFPQAIFKGFHTRKEAASWLREFPLDRISKEAPNLAENLDDETGDLPTFTQVVAALLESGKVVMFTDGSVIVNSGSGGYGVILKYKESVKELSGGFRRTTSNRMEIMACIVGLRALKSTSAVVIFSDSRYVVNSMSKGWAKKWRAKGWMRNASERAENPDLWAQLLELCSQHKVEFRWVKGHNNTAENERCDQLALNAAREKNLPIDEGYENPGLLVSNVT